MKPDVNLALEDTANRHVDDNQTSNEDKKSEENSDVYAKVDVPMLSKIEEPMTEDFPPILDISEEQMDTSSPSQSDKKQNNNMEKIDVNQDTETEKMEIDKSTTEEKIDDKSKIHNQNASKLISKQGLLSASDALDLIMDSSQLDTANELDESAFTDLNTSTEDIKMLTEDSPKTIENIETEKPDKTTLLDKISNGNVTEQFQTKPKTDETPAIVPLPTVLQSEANSNVMCDTEESSKTKNTEDQVQSGNEKPDEKQKNRITADDTKIIKEPVKVADDGTTQKLDSESNLNVPLKTIDDVKKNNITEILNTSSCSVVLTNVEDVEKDSQPDLADGDSLSPLTIDVPDELAVEVKKEEIAMLSAKKTDEVIKKEKAPHLPVKKKASRPKSTSPKGAKVISHSKTVSPSPTNKKKRPPPKDEGQVCVCILRVFIRFLLTVIAVFFLFHHITYLFFYRMAVTIFTAGYVTVKERYFAVSFVQEFFMQNV